MFVIAAQQRTGSHMLASMLDLGSDPEIFGFKPNESIEAKLDMVRSPSQPGVIIHDTQWNGLELEWKPDKIIWLSRRDIFRQAASCWMFNKLGPGACWQSKYPQDRRVELNAVEIFNTWKWLTWKRHELLAAMASVPSIVLEYETLTTESSLSRIESFLNQSIEHPPTTTRSCWESVVVNYGHARSDFEILLRSYARC